VAASIPFFIAIVAFMAYCIVEFRAKPDDPPDKEGEPIHGSTKLELIWTAIPLVVVMMLGVYSWMVLDRVEAKQKKPLVVKVVGQQFIWNYEYLKDGDKKLGIKTSGDLVVPVNRPLDFQITSEDVIHSFWVPAARLARDATPGVVTPLRFTPEKTGSYDIVCNELCGVGHTVMRAKLRVISQQDFGKWVAQQGGGGSGATSGGAAGGPDGKAVFNANGCGGCHVLAAAGGVGTAGPKLDGLGLSAAQIRESIVSPNAQITKGYPKGIMPLTFGKTLSQPELDALVKFIAASQ
jgi:cytochrome c oxidase subunit 2